MAVVRFGAFVVEGVVNTYNLIFDLGWQFVSYSAGPLPIGAVATIILLVALLPYVRVPPPV